jgi:transcriptional regulator of nitric oxide reductase
MGDEHRDRSLSRHALGKARRPALAIMLLVAVFSAARAKVLVTPEEAVREAFAGASAEKRTDYLDQTQAEAIAKLAGSAPSSRIVISYRASRDGRALGAAYLETHVVRTLPESILVVLDPQGRVAKVEILSFDEPDQYRPKPRWMDQFTGRTLDGELSLATGIRGVTGATLSSRAITAAVRRVLATDQILRTAARSSSADPSRSSPAPTPAATAPTAAAPKSPPPGTSRQPASPPRDPRP